MSRGLRPPPLVLPTLSVLEETARNYGTDIEGILELAGGYASMFGYRGVVISEYVPDREVEPDGDSVTNRVIK